MSRQAKSSGTRRLTDSVAWISDRLEVQHGLVAKEIAYVALILLGTVLLDLLKPWLHGPALIAYTGLKWVGCTIFFLLGVVALVTGAVSAGLQLVQHMIREVRSFTRFWNHIRPP